MASFNDIFQQITGGKSSGPSSNPNAAAITGMFHPGQYGAVNAQIASNHAGGIYKTGRIAPAKGDKNNLAIALNNIDKYSANDKVRIAQRAAAAGMIDRQKAADFTQQTLNGVPNPQQHLNLWQKGVLNTVNAGKAVGGALISPEKQVASYVGTLDKSNQNAIGQQSDSAYQSLKDAHAAFKKGDITRSQYLKIATNSATNADQAAAAARLNAQQVVANSNPRRTIAATAETALTPFLYGTPEGGATSYTAAAGATKGLSAAQKTAALAAQGITGGLLGAAEAKKFNSKEALKQAAIGGGIPVAAHLLGAAGSRVAQALSDNAPKDIGNVLNEKGLTSLAPTKIPRTDVATSALHLPGKNMYAEVSPDQLKVLKNEVGNIPFSKDDMPHLTPVSKLENAGVQKVSLDDLAKQSPNIKTALSKVEAPSIESKVVSATPFTDQVSKTLDRVQLAHTGAIDSKGSLGEVKNLFTPGGGAEGKGIANDLRATTGNLALQKNTETLAAKPDINFFKGQSTGDNLNFIQKIESGVKQSTPELQTQADKLRTAQEADYALGQSIKPNLVHVENYFPRAGFWDNSKQQVDSFLSKWQQPTLGGKATALQQRTVPTIYDGIKAGLVPKESNPAIIALNSRAQLLRAKAAQDFIEKQVAAGHDPALVQEYVNRVMDKGLSASPTFNNLKQATYALNNLQLGLSGFHVTGTGINAIVSQFANGLQDIVHGKVAKGAFEAATSAKAPLQYLFQGNKIVKDYKAGNITQDIKNIAEGGGRIGSQVDYRTSGLAKSLDQLTSGSAKEAAKGVAAAPFRAFSTAAKPIMEYWVPRIKAGATKELIDRKLSELGPNASEAAIRAAKADAIDSIDNRFGQLVKDNLLWKKTIKDGSGLLMRSPGWNIGTVRELGGGVKDLATMTARGKGLSERSAYTASLAATTMMMGTAISYMFTGKPPQSPMDYFYPKTGKVNKSGDEERVSLPTYAKDVFAFVHNPASTIQNKTNPLISTAKEVASNKDYFGNMVRNPEDSALTQAKQTAGFIGKNALPFTITNSNQRVDKGVETKLQSVMGLNPAPGYITKSPFEQSVQSALTQSLGSKSLTPEEQALVTAKSGAKSAQQGGDSSKIQQLLNSGQITQKQADNLKSSAGQSSVAGQFSYLLKVDKPAAAKVIDKATPADIVKLGDLNEILKSLAVSSSGKANPQTKQAATKLLQVLNNTKYNTQDLINQHKAATRAKAAATRASKKGY